MKGIGMKRFSGYSAAMVVIAAAMLAGCPTTPATHTQEFTAGSNNLAGNQLYFIPTPSVDFYQRMVQSGITEVPNPTDNATAATFTGGQAQVNLGSGNAVSFYGKLYETVYIGSNGAIGMGQAGDNSSLTAHFSQPEVSLLPVEAIGTGAVSYEVTAGDNLAVTYEGVTAGGASATAQAEFFIGTDMYGDIALSYPEIDPATAGVIGLSAGQLAGANAAQIAAFLSDFQTQTGGNLTDQVLTGTVAASS